MLAIRALVATLVLGALPSAGAAPRPPELPTLRLALLNDSVSLPSPERLFTGFNPGLEVGAELPWNELPEHRLFQSVDLAVFHHPGLDTCTALTTSFGYRPTLVAGLFLELSVGLGYLLSVPEWPAFIETTEGFRAGPAVQHHVLLQTAVGVGYRLGAFEPFLAWSLAFQTPWVPVWTSVLPRQQLHLGLRFHLPSAGGGR